MYRFRKSCVWQTFVQENHSIYEQSKPNLVYHLCNTRAISVTLVLQLELFQTSLFPWIACWTASKSDRSYPISAAHSAPYFPSPAHYHLMILLSGRGWRGEFMYFHFEQYLRKYLKTFFVSQPLRKKNLFTCSCYCCKEAWVTEDGRFIPRTVSRGSEPLWWHTQRIFSALHTRNF